MSSESKKRQISYKYEERLNAATHGLGTVMACLGMYYLQEHVSAKTPFVTESLVLYSLSMILLFATSTAYHLVTHPAWKRRLRIADHISIYFLIAGTYSPVALITLVHGDGWTLFYLVWGIALAGTVMKLFFTGKYEYVSLLLYLFMGWLIVIDIQDLIRLSTTRGLVLLGTGGAFYTLGIFFYTQRRIPYNHLIWHFFVLGGAFSHWFYIYLEVA